MSDTNFLEMSDEDILNMPDSELEKLATVDTEPEVVDTTSTEESSTEGYTEASNDTSEEGSTTNVAEQTSTDTQVDVPDSKEESQADVTKADVKEVSDKEAAIDYKAAYERILAPFKANGKTIQVDSIEDAVTLMQMGANYSKKMETFKPYMRVVKMLEDNQLLDEAKLNMLIEVAKGKPEAIKKLVADSGLDAYSMNPEEDSKYAPADYRVNDSQLELDNVIKELQDSPVFNRTAQVVGQLWDAKSRADIAENPAILRDLNAHIESGTFDIVVNEIEKQKMLGRVPAGVSDLELYSITAKYLSEMQAKQTANKPVQQNNNVVEQQRQARKHSIAPTQTTTGAKSSMSMNPLDMSDEEFEKVSKQLFRSV